jgi:transketolase
VSAAVVDVHTIKPLDAAAVETACRATKLIVTVEEHGIVGGLGGAVAECRSALAGAPPHVILGLPDRFGKVADYAFLLQKYGLTAPALADRIFEAWTRVCGGEKP